MKYGLDQLIRSLKDKSQVVVDNYHEETAQQAAELRHHLLEEAQQKYNQNEQKIKEQAHLQQERQFSAYRARSNQEVLQYKVELIERLIEEVKNEFMTMDDELFKTYFQRHCYAQRHIKVVKTTTKRQAVIAEIIEENKFEIDLQIDESIVDGFILVADHIDYNYEFDKLFAYYHEQLVEFTRKGLFNE
ncbi:MAG TPA: hypothetical protein GX741_02120 [Erysipelothrix sp.]|nr:hypothetical protein [Erysipelothrix sp.]